MATNATNSCFAWSPTKQQFKGQSTVLVQNFPFSIPVAQLIADPYHYPICTVPYGTTVIGVDFLCTSPMTSVTSLRLGYVPIGAYQEVELGPTVGGAEKRINTSYLGYETASTTGYGIASSNSSWTSTWTQPTTATRRKYGRPLDQSVTGCADADVGSDLLLFAQFSAATTTTPLAGIIILTLAMP